MPKQNKRKRTNGPAKKTTIPTGVQMAIQKSEKKNIDTSYSGAIVAPTDCSGAEADPSTLLCLNACAEGDTAGQRDGRKIKIDSVYVKGMIYEASRANQTTADSGVVYYIALVLDKQSNGAQLDSEKVFKNTSGSVTLGGLPMRNLDYLERFDVLKETIIEEPTRYAFTDAANQAAIAGFVRPFQLYHKFKKDLQTTFSASTAVIGSIVDTSLHVICMCNSVTGTPTLAYNARVRFYDN